MLGIIFQHSYQVNFYILNGEFPLLVFFTLKNIMKYGTIVFFIASGFLLGQSLENESALSILKKKKDKIIKPYLIFLSLYIITLPIKDLFTHYNPIDPNFFIYILKKIHIGFFQSNYWFIISFFISLIALLAFKKFLQKNIIGYLLSLITLFYAINVHTEWITPLHTTAYIGFTFFMWLGFKLYNIRDKFLPFLDKSCWEFLFSLVCLALIISVFESYILYWNKSEDPLNSIRFSNILYSMAVFLFLAKLGMTFHFKRAHPRTETFGLFLIHPFTISFLKLVIIVIFPFLEQYLNTKASNVSVFAIFFIQLFMFLATYFITLFLVKTINRTKFKWLMGQ